MKIFGEELNNHNKVNTLTDNFMTYHAIGVRQGLTYFRRKMCLNFEAFYQIVKKVCVQVC